MSTSVATTDPEPAPTVVPNAPPPDLALHYGFAVDDPATHAFVARARARLVAPPESRSLIDAAHALGYLDAAERTDIDAGAIAAQTPAGACVVAGWLLAHGWIGARGLVDLCEEIDQPLVACPTCRTAWWCDRHAPELPAACPACSCPMRPLTWLPRRGIVAPALGELSLERVALVHQRPLGSLGLRLALHYQLITPQAAFPYLAWDPAADGAIAAQMFEDGRLSVTAFGFLEHRLREVSAKGLAPVPMLTPSLAELCRHGGYLGRAPAARLAEVGLGENEPPGPARDHRELGAIQALYNLGELPYFQAIDLLERRGIALDRCLACRRHWRVSASRPRGPCPGCGRPVVRLAGTSQEVELGVAPPADRHWAIREVEGPTSVRVARADDDAPADAFAEAAGPIPGTVPSSLVEVATQTLPRTFAITDDDVRAVILHLRLLDHDGLAAASRIARDNDTLLLRVLAGMGFVPLSAISYVRRRLRIDPPLDVRGASLLELACRLGYLPPAMRAVEDDGRLAEIHSLRVLEAAYNTGRLALWQLVDLLELTGVHLAHCGECRREVHVAPGEASSLAAGCPLCGAGTVALSDPARSGDGPGAWRVPLPAISALRILSVEDCRVRVASRGEGGADDVDDAPLEGDERIAQLIYRYRLVPMHRLALDLREFETRGGELDLEDWLFQAGQIDATMLAFLAGHRSAPPGAAERAAGGQRLVELAMARGALSPRRYDELYGVPGAPNPDTLDAIDFASDLERRGGLEAYQVVDLVEAAGVVLFHCEQCVCQIAPQGELGRADEYSCPLCGACLLWLTPHPDRPHRVDRVPDRLRLYVLRLDASDLVAKSAPGRSTGTPRLADTTPPLLELALDAPQPAAPRPRTTLTAVPRAEVPPVAFAPPVPVPVVSASRPPTLASAAAPPPALGVAPRPASAATPASPAVRAVVEPATSVRLRERKAQAVAQALATHRRRATTVPAPSAPIDLVQPLPDGGGRERADAAARPARRVYYAIAATFLVVATATATLAIGPLVAPRPAASHDSVGATGPAPSPQPAQGESVIVWGVVVPRKERSPEPCRALVLQVDLDQDIWVCCSTNDLSESFARVLELALQNEGKVFVKVVGEVRRADTGELYVEATELYRAHPPLPRSRWVPR